MTSVKRRAVFVGVEQYEFFSGTDYCHADVNLLADTLIQHCDYAETDISRLLLDRDSDVSPKDLLDEIDNVARRTRPGDTVLFYFAGHGHSDGSSSYLILPDTERGRYESTAVDLREISDRLRKPGCFCFRIFDACRSGRDVRAPSGESPLDQGMFIKRAIESSSAEGWVTLAACREDEDSHPDVLLKQGVFTHYLSKAIKQFSPGSEVYPEALKLEVCKAVSSWARDHNVTQTPTFNTSVSGNISIACRKDVALSVQSSETSLAVSDGALATRNLEDRIKRVKRFTRVGDDKHNEALVIWMEEIKTNVERSIQKIDWGNGVAVFMGAVQDANNMLAYVKNLVVPAVRSSNLRALHTLETKVKREEWRPNQLLGLVALFAKQEPRIISITHSIDQRRFPDSYIAATMSSDGVMPEAIFFSYLLPLQVSVCVYLGGLLKPADGGDTWKEVKLSSNILSLSDNNREQLASLVNLAVIELHERYMEEARSMVSYLEWEIEQACLESEDNS